MGSSEGKEDLLMQVQGTVIFELGFAYNVTLSGPVRIRHMSLTALCASLTGRTSHVVKQTGHK